MGRDVLDRLSDETLVALRCDGAAWPRALLSATRIPDKWMALLERRDGSRKLIPAGEEPPCERGDRLILVRNRPFTVPLTLGETRAASGHNVSGSCELQIRWQFRDDDLAALAHALLAGDDLSLGALAQAVADAGGQGTLRQFVRERPAARLVHADVTDDLAPLLRTQLKRFLFSTGATLDGVLRSEFSCPALLREEAQQRESAADLERIRSRELVEQAALAATQRRLEGLSGIFEKLKAAGNGDEQWHELLPALSPAERGRLLENLWRITPDQLVAEAIVVVAGAECLWLDPVSPDHIVRRVALPAEFGGLRSVRFCREQRWLLIGAASGVWVVDSADGRVVARYSVPNASRPRTGFNAAAVAGRSLFATHSQLGAWTWELDGPQTGRPLLEPRAGTPKAIRAVTALADGRIALAADHVVRLFDATGTPVEFAGQLPATIHCLAALDHRLYAGVEDGALFGCELDEPDGWVRLHRAPGLCQTVHPRRWNDLIELVIPGGAQGILGVFSQEGIVAQLAASSVPIRRAWACDDLVAGLSDNRDKLIVLNAHRPERSPREVPIGRTLGYLVEDACLVVKHVVAGPRAGQEAG